MSQARRGWSRPALAIAASAACLMLLGFSLACEEIEGRLGSAPEHGLTSATSPTPTDPRLPSGTAAGSNGMMFRTDSTTMPRPGGRQHGRLDATDGGFTLTALEAKAGQPVALVIRNTGSRPHNWHVLGTTDEDSHEIRTSNLAPGQSTRITFTIAVPGTYTFRCELHPAMRGTITLE